MSNRDELQQMPLYQKAEQIFKPDSNLESALRSPRKVEVPNSFTLAFNNIFFMLLNGMGMP